MLRTVQLFFPFRSNLIIQTLKITTWQKPFVRTRPGQWKRKIATEKTDTQQEVEAERFEHKFTWGFRGGMTGVAICAVAIVGNYLYNRFGKYQFLQLI